MSISTKLITAIDSIIYAFKTGVKTSLKDYSELESVVNPTTLISKNGSLATIFEIYGATKSVGDEEISEIEDKLFTALTSSLSREGHQLQFVFSKDKDRIGHHIKETIEPYKKAAKRLQFDLDDFFDAKVEHLSNFCAYESCYLVVWSKPELIKENLKEEQDIVSKKSKDVPLFIDSQNIIIEYERLESIHSAFCDVISSAFKKAQINIEQLHVRKAIKEIKRSISHKYTSQDWEPSLPIPLTEDLKEVIKNPIKDDFKMRRSNTDISNLMWPSISEQIFSVDVDVVDSGTIKMGDKYLSSMYVDIPPQNTMPFKTLIDSIDSETPFQISFTLESGGLNKAKLKAMAASILAVTNSGNKMVRDSINSLRQRELEGESIIKMSINATTWSSEIKELNVRKQVLLKKLQNWGNAQIAFNTIDPIEGVLSTSPAVTYKNPANPSLAPLIDVIKMLPLSRQSHIWKSGSVLFRTYDGKLFPMQPGSSLQLTWNDLLIATPGSGKSVLMNAMNLSSIFEPGAEFMPIVGIIDFGPSSSGLIQLLRDALPEHLKHLALYEKILNTPKYATNFMDTFVGLRYPTSSDYVFSQNFLNLLVTPTEGGSNEGSDAMCLKIIKKAYEYYSDEPDAHPKMYNYGVDDLVDNKLKELKIDGEESEFSWWKITDILFDNGDVRLAGRSQRYAVPLLEELVEIAYSTPSIFDMYEKMIARTGETMIEVFSRSVSEAVLQYPMLNMPTKFDVSESRIVSLDIDQVAKGLDPSSMKQTAIMLMISRFMVGRNFKVDEKELREVASERYLNHHLKRAAELFGTKKRLCIDEFHRTKGVESLTRQIIIDEREGRKWNLQVTLASQIFSDYHPELIKLCTGAFVMSGSNNMDDLVREFGYNKTTAELAKNGLTGPGRNGVPLIYACKTNIGSYSQFLYFTISPLEIWAFSTTSEDVVLRNRLTEELGSASEARSLLAKTFKSGSAKKNIERLLNTSKDNDVLKDPYKYLIDVIKEKNGII